MERQGTADRNRQRVFERERAVILNPLGAERCDVATQDDGSHSTKSGWRAKLQLDAHARKEPALGFEECTTGAHVDDAGGSAGLKMASRQAAPVRSRNAGPGSTLSCSDR
jgi:hypothetical protein